MKYRVTCLTPTLVGDGQKLAPIDYMVWKDHVNVLDQRRIFRLLAKGPRLDSYLEQLKKADRLDFEAWGGFAQNYAGRRIPFEHASSIPVWQRQHAEDLFIPTFATNLNGPYLPGTALKGALRSGSVFDRWTEKTIHDLAEHMEDRVPRYFSSRAEAAVLGGSGSSRMRRVAVADSDTVAYAGMKVYLLRTATLMEPKKEVKGTEPLQLGWKSQRGSVEARRVDEASAWFAEMAAPGTVFDGIWRERGEGDRAKAFAASNRYAEAQLARHREYAERTGMKALSATLEQLSSRLQAAQQSDRACLLSIGWGGGLVGKSAYLNSEDESYRKIMRQMPLYQRAIQTGMPFPKTRRVIFEGNQPASLPGWVMLEVG